MAEFKKSPTITAIPIICDRCGRHVPLYRLLIEYKTKKNSEDHHDGLTEIEVGYNDGYYCRKCIKDMDIL